MSQVTLKKALDQLRFKYFCKEKDQFNIIELNQSSECDNFNMLISFYFDEDFLVNIEIIENRYLNNYYPRFLIKHEIAKAKYSILLVTDNKFKYTDCTSIQKSNKIPREVLSDVQNIIISFTSFMGILKKTYETYSQIPMKWVKENLPPEKQNCLATCWNIPKNSSFIVINEDELKSRTGMADVREFKPFTIVITTNRTAEVEIKVLFASLMIQNYRMIEMKVQLDRDFKDLLIEIYDLVINESSSLKGGFNESFFSREHLNFGNQDIINSNQSSITYDNVQKGKYSGLDSFSIK